MKIHKAFYPFIISLILAFGIFLGYKLQERNHSTNIFSSATNSKLEYILKLIDARYVDSVDVNKLYDGALVSMLEKLDPHSVYLPPVELKNEDEIMAGEFEGIGVEFNIQNDTILIVTPISGGPSELVGISAGDKIIKIEDTLVAGIKITNEMVMKKLKGKKDTKVKITVLKNGGHQLKTYIIKRDKIPLYSVDAGFMVDNKTGYIKINRFALNTYTEFMQKLEPLTLKGMQNLIIDLRQNPGGFMEPAINIADELLDGKKTIVYTEGKNVPKTYSNAMKVGMFEEGKLAILIDEGSASASEIISGAIQDWDRGVIIGRRSFGKGLVQQQYPIEDGSAIRLTIARYYTPSGRSIQRSYENGTESYYADVTKRYKDGEIFKQNDSLIPKSKITYKTKVKNRTVYGGGGINPDIFIAFDTSNYNALVSEIYNLNTLQEFTFKYFNENKNTFAAYKNLDNFNNTYTVNDAVYNSFLQYSISKGLNKNVLNLSAKSKPFLIEKIKALLAKQMYKNDGFYKVNIANDNAVKQALIYFSKN